ncbi:MFS transporter [Chloroflexota bacterium]
MKSKDTIEVKNTASRHPSYHWAVLGAALCVAIVAYAVHYSFGIFFKPLSDEFNWTRAMTSGAFSLYMLSRGGFGILTGWATDKYGPRITVATGGFCIGIGLILTSQVSAIWQLYIFYSLLVGLGVSVAFAPLIATTARWFVKKRGLATGIVLAGVGLGTALMPKPASYLIDTYSWSTSYIIIGLFAMAAMGLAAIVLRRTPEECGLLPYGITKAQIHNQNVETDKSSFTIDKKGFSLREATRIPSFWMLFIITILFATCLYMVMIHIVQHASDVGISMPVAASFLAVIGVSTIAGRLAAGWLSDAIGKKPMLTICLLLQAGSVFSLMGINNVAAFYVFAIVFGLVYGGIVTQLPLIAGELFGLHSIGAIVGLEMLGTSLGGALGPILGGYVFDVTNSYSSAFLSAATGLLVATLLIPLLKPPKNK